MERSMVRDWWSCCWTAEKFLEFLELWMQAGLVKWVFDKWRINEDLETIKMQIGGNIANILH